MIFYTVSIQSAFATKYNVKINVFSNEKSFPRKPFSYYIDFGQEINLTSLKMTVAGKKDKQVPVYIMPTAKYKALIYFMPHKKMNEDSELYYILSFESGKWDGKSRGSDSLRKKITINPNLIPNYSFEERLEDWIYKPLEFIFLTYFLAWVFIRFFYKIFSI